MAISAGVTSFNVSIHNKMFLSPIYGLNLASLVGNDFSEKGVTGGSSVFPMSLGSGYSDAFSKNRAPSQAQLLSNLVGTAFRCANLNSNLLATSRLRLYIKTRHGESRAKFVQFAEDYEGRKVTAPISKAVKQGWRHAKMLAGTMAKSALIDASQDAHDLEEVIEHPILDLLRQPEDNLDDGGLTSYDHRWTTQMLLETLGRAYWYVKEWKSSPGLGRIPKSLLLLRSQLVIEIVDTTGKKYIDHYKYGTNNLDPHDVIRFAQVDPSNPHLGFLSPMRAADELIGLSRGGLAFMSALLQNGGYPAGFFTPKGDSEGGGIGSAEARRVQGSIRSGFAMANAGRIMVLEHPGQLQSISFKPTEIIDNDRARELAGGIADCFDVPRTKLFRDTSNRAAGESGDMDHAKDAGLSRCTRLEEVLNSQLIPLFDESKRLLLAFDSPLPAERTLILDETRLGGQLGIADVNENREALGYEVVDEPIGKVRIIPDKSLLVLPDGSLLGDPGKLDQAKAEAVLNPPPLPVNPNATPAEPKPKKSKRSAERRMLRRLIGLMENHNGIQRASTNSESVDAKLLRSMPAVHPEGWDVLPDVRNSDGLEANAKPSSAAAAAARSGKDAVKAALVSRGYTEAEAEEKLKPNRNGHVHASL